MAKKSLGHVELEWQCPVCDTRNPGSARVCGGCGNPQPDDVQFEAPVRAEMLSRAEADARTGSGPDVHCPYCDARNPADAQTCHQCGADLSDATARATGAVVGAFREGPPPDVTCTACGTVNPGDGVNCKTCGAALPKPGAAVPEPPRVSAQPQAAAKGSRSCLFLFAGAVGVAIIAFIVFAALSRRTQATFGTVSGVEWQRAVEVAGLVPVEHENWLADIPVDATVIACVPEVRRTVDEEIPGSEEVCGTPYVVDEGTGVGEVVQDCVYRVYEDKCTYMVDEWQIVDRIVAQGQDRDPVWPDLTLAADQQEGEREEILECFFTANDQTYGYRAKSIEEFSSCIEGTRWELEVNSFGRAINAVPVD